MNKQTTQNNIEEKILHKIESEHIEPKPRWEFLLRKSYVWILGTVTIVLGALSVSATIFVFRNIPWELSSVTHDNFTSFILEFIPYLWTLLCTLFLFSTYFLIRKTEKGYRYQMTIIVLFIMGASISLGSVFYIIGFGEKIDNKLDNTLPLHRGIMRHNRMIFENPEEGLLLGKVSLKEGSAFITNFKGDDLELIVDHLGTTTVNTLYSESPVRIIGLVKEGKFFVCGAFLDVGQGKRRFQRVDMFFERKENLERSKECEGVQPYQRLIRN